MNTGIYGFVDKELEMFRKYKIEPFFIFQGESFFLFTDPVSR